MKICIRRILICVLSVVVIILAGCTTKEEKAEQALGTLGISYTGDSFVKAAMENNVKVVKLFVDAKMPLEMLGKDGGTPLMAAASGDNLEIIDILLEAGANVDFTDSRGRTAAYVATYKNNPLALEKLLDAGANVHQIAQGETLLQIAMQQKADKAATLLLERGIDVNKATSGLPALHSAVINGDIEMVKLLLEKGAEADQVIEGEYPLFIAIGKGQIEIVDLLLGKGVDVNKTIDDWSALLMALRNENYEMLNHLINAGVKTDISYENQDLLSYLLERLGEPGVEDSIISMLKMGTQIPTSDEEFLLPAIDAGASENLLISLIDAGAYTDIRIPASANVTLLTYAKENNYAKMAEMLIGNGKKQLSLQTFPVVSYTPGVSSTSPLEDDLIIFQAGEQGAEPPKVIYKLGGQATELLALFGSPDHAIEWSNFREARIIVKGDGEVIYTGFSPGRIKGALGSKWEDIFVNVTGVDELSIEMDYTLANPNGYRGSLRFANPLITLK